MVNGKIADIRKIGIWEAITLFFMTLGIISFMTSVGWSKIFTGTTRSWMETTPGIGILFVALASLMSVSITFKSFTTQKLFNARSMIIVFALFFIIWMLYSIIPTWMPPAFSVIFR